MNKYVKIKSIWYAMLYRCSEKSKGQALKDYKDRGIIVCKEWRESFEEFLKWAISNGYKEGLSIDRIDNNGNYSPSNCRFSTREVQQRNTRLIRKSNSSGFRGVNKYRCRGKQIIGKSWRAQIRVSGHLHTLGYSDCRLKCAYIYDMFVIENKLEHPTNIITKSNTC